MGSWGEGVESEGSEEAGEAAGEDEDGGERGRGRTWWMDKDGG